MMEGDSPTGARVLSEYRRLENILLKMEAETQYRSLHKMIGVMRKKLAVYHNEALSCNTLVMATVLNPSKRMKFFENYYPAEVPRIRTLLDQAFQKKVELSDTVSSPSAPATSQNNNPIIDTHDDDNLFGPSEVSESINRSDELDLYLGSKYPYKDGCILKWWKASISLYPSILLWFLSLMCDQFGGIGEPQVVSISRSACEGLSGMLGYHMCSGKDVFLGSRCLPA